MSRYQSALGAEIRRRRLELGWSQEQLAAKAGKHWTYIGGVERGERNPTLLVIADIAKALGVEPRELLPASRGGGS